MAIRSRTNEFIKMRNLQHDQKTYINNKETSIDFKYDNIIKVYEKMLIDIKSNNSLIRDKIKILNSSGNYFMNDTEIINVNENIISINVLIDINKNKLQTFFSEIKKLPDDNISVNIKKRYMIILSELVKETHTYSKSINVFENKYIHQDQHLNDNVIGIGNANDDYTYEHELLIQEFDQSQIKNQIDENTKLIDQRERDINKLLTNITELNKLFNDILILLVDQGTMLDTIENNIYIASNHIESGNNELEKASTNQKKAGNKKKYILLALGAVATIMSPIVALKLHK
jgi:hypothetical protein